jgi:hypothetical protein
MPTDNAQVTVVDHRVQSTYTRHRAGMVQEWGPQESGQTPFTQVHPSLQGLAVFKPLLIQ